MPVSVALFMCSPTTYSHAYAHQAPLILSADLPNLQPEILNNIVGNEEVIAVNQDPLGIQVPSVLPTMCFVLMIYLIPGHLYPNSDNRPAKSSLMVVCRCLGSSASKTARYVPTLAILSAWRCFIH